MKYRVVEYTYANDDKAYAIQIQKASNEDYQPMSGVTFKSEAKAVEYINDQIAAEAATTLVAFNVLPGEYE